jgi:predicted aconitase
VADKEDKMADFDFANLGNLFGGGMSGGTPSGLDALLSEDQRKLLGRNATLSAAAALLQASGRGPQRIGLGQALGSALQAGQQGYQQARAGSFQDLVQNLKRCKQRLLAMSLLEGF